MGILELFPVDLNNLINTLLKTICAEVTFLVKICTAVLYLGKMSTQVNEVSKQKTISASINQTTLCSSFTLFPKLLIIFK